MSDDGTPPAQPGITAEIREEIRAVAREVAEQVVGAANADTAGRRSGRRVVETRLDAESEVEERITAAVQKLQAKDRAENERKAHGDRLAKVEERVAEKPPVERSWLHKIMGYGEPDK